MVNTDEVLNPLSMEREKHLVQAANRYLNEFFSRSHRPITAMEEFIDPLRQLGSESSENMTVISNNVMNLSLSREVASSDTRTAEVLESISEVANTFEKLGTKSAGASARYIRRIMKNRDVMRAAANELSKLRNDVSRISLTINQHKERSLNNLDFMRECLHYVETLKALYEENPNKSSVSLDNQQRFSEVIDRKRIYLMEAITVGVQSCLTFDILQDRFIKLHDNLESARTVLIPSINNAITLQIAIAEGQAEEEEIEDISIQGDAEVLNENGSGERTSFADQVNVWVKGVFSEVPDVSDSGDGNSKKNKNIIFARFRQAKKNDVPETESQVDDIVEENQLVEEVIIEEEENQHV